MAEIVDILLSNYVDIMHTEGLGEKLDRFRQDINKQYPDLAFELNCAFDEAEEIWRSGN